MENNVRALSKEGAAPRQMEVASEALAIEIRAAVEKACKANVPAGIVHSVLAMETHTVLHAMLVLR